MLNPKIRFLACYFARFDRSNFARQMEIITGYVSVLFYIVV